MNKITPYLQKLLETFKRYVFVICVVLFGGLYGTLIYTAGQQAALEPSESEITEKYKAAARPKLDEDTVNKLESLESTNVDVQAIFDEARQNPFNE